LNIDTVNAKQFLNLVYKGNSLQKEEFQALVKLQETFAYFVVPKILAAKYEKLNTNGSSTELLHWAAIQSPSRRRLKQLIEQEIDFLPAADTAVNQIKSNTSTTPEKDTQEETKASSSEHSREEILRRLEENLNRFKNNTKRAAQEVSGISSTPVASGAAEDLIESIKKKGKKAVLDARKKEQNELIKAFSKKSAQIAAIKESKDAANLADLSKSSTTFNDKIVSEAFAKLLVKQHNKQQAIEIYRKLILKFPEKSAYFAALIKELEE